MRHVAWHPLISLKYPDTLSRSQVCATHLKIDPGDKINEFPISKWVAVMSEKDRHQVPAMSAGWHALCIGSYQIRKIAGRASARNAGNVFPASYVKGNRELAIPACNMTCVRSLSGKKPIYNVLAGPINVMSSERCCWNVKIKNTKAPCHWSLWVEFTGDRWIPRTKGQ